MEDKGKKCVTGQPSFPNRPPVSPKPFTAAPPPPPPPPTFLAVARGLSEVGPQQMLPYPMNHGETSSYNLNDQFRPELFKGTSCPPPPLDVVSNDKPQMPPILYRNPIRSVEPSVDNDGAIIVKTELGIDYEMKWGHSMEPNVNNKRFRRILSNRISAQKSRTRKLQFVSDLERKRKDLEMEIAKLGPLVENEQEKLKQLQMENHFLQERMSIYEAKAKLSIALVEENQTAVRRLKEAYEAQQRNMYAMQAGEGQYWNSSSSNARSVNIGHEQQMMMTGDSSSLAPMAEDQALSFTSLAIDPPKSLHDDDAKY